MQIVWELPRTHSCDHLRLVLARHLSNAVGELSQACPWYLGVNILTLHVVYMVLEFPLTLKIILQAGEGRKIAQAGRFLDFICLIIWGMGHRYDTVVGNLGLVTHAPLARALRHLGAVKRDRIHCGSRVVRLKWGVSLLRHTF